MENETHALGKDSPYQSSISTMSQLLADHGFDIEEVSWQNPVPNVWSVHIRDRNCPQLFTNGKGHSRDSALASALGEFHERVACDFFVDDYYFGKEIADSSFVHHPNEKWFPIKTPFRLDSILPKELAAFYDESSALVGTELIDFNSGNTARGICTLPFVRINDNKEVYFPVNILNNLYVSNGMAAGNTLHEARVQALSEIIERYVKNRIISECITLPDVPPEILCKYPKITSGINKLEQEGFHILVKDASLGMEFPVINVTLLNPRDNGVFAAFGAHPIFELALERTLTELLQGRSLDTLNNFPSPAFHVEEVANPHNLEMHFVDSTGLMHFQFLRNTPDYPFSNWDFKGGTEEQYDFLLSIVHNMEKQIYIADYTHFGVYCCRIVVPGISEIYPVEDIAFENKSVSLPVRDVIMSPSSMTNHARLALYEFMEEMSFPPEQPLYDLIGILPSEDSSWASLCVGEFNAMLCLACKNKEDATIWSEWCAASALLSAQKQMLYKCIFTILTIENDETQELSAYHEALKKLFGEKLFLESLSMVNGNNVFDQLNNFEYDSKIDSTFAPHIKLLDAYQKCQRAKSKPSGAKLSLPMERQ